MAATLSSINIVESKLITLTEGNDTYSNTIEGATIAALGGNDWIQNRVSNVSIDGGDGNDDIGNSGSNVTINAGAGDDTVGNSSDDNPYNYGQNSTINLGDGNDVVLNDADYVSIDGGAGNDTISGGAGTNSLFGGAGDDVFLWRKGDGSAVITDYANDDMVSIQSDTVTRVTKSKDGKDKILNLNGGKKITVKGGNAEDLVITYYDDNGLHSAPEVVTFNKKGTGATITADYVKDEFDIADYYEYKDSVVTIDASQATIDLSITGSKKKNKIIGSDGNDYIDGVGGKNTLDGGDGKDTLVGGSGNDSLYGGAGNDSLWGGLGDDTLTGGDGNDTFVYNYGSSNNVVITDFTPRIDTIMILSGQEGYDGYETSNNGDVTFKFNDGGQIVVQGAGSKSFSLVDSKRSRVIDY